MKVAVPAEAAVVWVPPTKLEPPIAAALRSMEPLKFSAMALLASRASTVTEKLVPA